MKIIKTDEIIIDVIFKDLLLEYLKIRYKIKQTIIVALTVCPLGKDVPVAESLFIISGST
jgi:hypothetical protein